MKIKRGIVAVCSAWLILNMLIWPDESVEAAKNALLLCANVLVPSLFPFFVFSALLIKTGVTRLITKPMSKIMTPLFGVSGSGALCFILGIVSGYPMGAACVCEMYETKSISKQDAEKLLAFCNNSGPLFIIGAFGSGMYMSHHIGVMVYLIHIVSSVIIGIALGAIGRKKEHKSSDNVMISCSGPIGITIKEAVTTSVNNMLVVCGFTVVFSLVINSLGCFGREVGVFLAPVLEISSGLHMISTSSLPLAHKIALSAAALGFSGISVHLQVASFVSKTNLSMKKYFVSKTIHAVLSFVFVYIFADFIALETGAWYFYPQMPYVTIDFSYAVRLSILYIVFAIAITIILWICVKISEWQEKVIHNND